MWLVLILLILSGCNSSTGPGNGGGTPVFEYEPADNNVVVNTGVDLDFVVNVSGAEGFTAEWKLDGQIVSQGTSFPYRTMTVGAHQVNVDLVYPGGSESHQWSVVVTEDPSTLPPAVGNVTLVEGSQPGSVKVRWTAVFGATYPVTSYEIACSFSGPLLPTNWDQADVQATEPAVTGIGYVRELTPQDGLVPGSRAWFGVRARDDHGQLSPLPASSPYLLSYPWYLSGHIQDDTGADVASAILTFFPGNTPAGSSDANGLFTKGPFSSVDSVGVTVQSIDPKYYKFTTPYLYADDADALPDITLIEKFGADATCAASGDFLDYLRYMTRTDENSAGTVLHKWNRYPVKVYFPEFTRTDGVDFRAVCLSAMTYWNTTLDEDLFEETAVEAEADVVLDFPELPSVLNGQVVLEEPQGSLGYVSPVRMRVDIDRNLLGQGEVDTELAIKGVCLHEFGHVMGLYRHSNCSDYHLMNDGSGSSAFKPSTLQPITDDEINAVRCLRYLNDGVDMNGYSNAGF